MSFNRLASSFVTKLMAVPFLPKRPERPILRIKRNLNNLPMQVIFSVRRKIVVDDQGHLLHIKTASPNIGRNQNSRLSSSEFFCNRFSFLLRHVTTDTKNHQHGVNLIHTHCIHIGNNIAGSNATLGDQLDSGMHTC